MAFVNQELKKEIKKNIDAVLAKKGLKGKLKYTLKIQHHSTLILTIKSGPFDFIGNYNDLATEKNKVRDRFSQVRLMDNTRDNSVNVYWIDEQFTGQCLEVIQALYSAMNIGNHDNSDIQSDYHDVGWYNDIKIGTFDKPYKISD